MLNFTGGLLYAVEYKNNGATLAHSLNLSAVYKPYDSLLLKSVYDEQINDFENRITTIEQDKDGDVFIKNNLYAGDKMFYHNNLTDILVPMPIYEHPSSVNNFSITFPYPVVCGTITCKVSISLMSVYYKINIHFKNNEIINSDELSKPILFKNESYPFSVAYDSSSRIFTFNMDGAKNWFYLQNQYPVDIFIFTSTYYIGNAIYSNDLLTSNADLSNKTTNELEKLVYSARRCQILESKIASLESRIAALETK
ncbi:hypothetical protein M9Y10_020514 [Tritrichomonas musculus]|uniref:Uncharacterized protein n=1 Tax=Tritrichomonas musculus TaxID=1915356 RepID=A0ABR2HGC0_9EUKA